MMHYSTLIYQTKKQKQAYAQDKNEYKHVKSMGSYFEAPLIQKTLSTKPHAFRNVFRSMVQQYAATQQKCQTHFLDLTPLQITTIKTMYLEKLQSKNNPNLIQAYRRHYRIDIKQYLKRKYRKHAYQLPLQAFELLRFIQDKDSKQPWKTKFIYLYKPFFINDNLKRRIQSNNDQNKYIQQMFMPKNLPILFKQLIKCSVQFGGLDNFIMTTQNVYMEQNLQTLQINYTSFTGLGLLKCESTIGAHQFFQVIPYFTQKMLQKKQIGVQQRIRFFLINCLSLMTKRNFTINVQQQVQAQKQFTIDQSRKKIKDRNKLQKQFQQQIKSIPQKKAYDKIKIKELLNKGLVLEENLTWHQIVSSICRGQNYKKYPDQKPSEQYGKKIQEAFRKFHEQVFNADPQKDFYIKRNLDSELLYIPIRFQADLNLIFKKKAWWEIFNIKSNIDGTNKPQFYNMFHENFCFRLLDIAIKKYENCEINQQWAKKFQSDPVIQIIFEYLTVSELPCLILKNFSTSNDQQQKQMEFETFDKIYKKYTDIKQKLKGIDN